MTANKKWDNRAKQYTVDDIRVHKASSLAIEVIKTMPRPETKRELQRYKREVGKIVGKEIGETPNDTLKDYVLPQVFLPWEEKLTYGGCFGDVFESIEDIFEQVQYGP